MTVLHFPRQPVIIDYTNWIGVRSERKIMPLGLHFGSNEWHPVKQWLLYAVDLEKSEKGAERFFALTNIHSWKQIE
jgi:predicted DNA-binding transcriptional regulator YafY